MRILMRLTRLIRPKPLEILKTVEIKVEYEAPATQSPSNRDLELTEPRTGGIGYTAEENSSVASMSGLSDTTTACESVTTSPSVHRVPTSWASSDTTSLPGSDAESASEFSQRYVTDTGMVRYDRVVTCAIVNEIPGGLVVRCTLHEDLVLRYKRADGTIESRTTGPEISRWALKLEEAMFMEREGVVAP